MRFIPKAAGFTLCDTGKNAAMEKVRKLGVKSLQLHGHMMIKIFLMYLHLKAKEPSFFSFFLFLNLNSDFASDSFLVMEYYLSKRT